MLNKIFRHGLKDCLPSENAKLLEGGKLVVGVACVACIMSCHFSNIFGIMQEYSRRLLVLQYILPSVELV